MEFTTDDCKRMFQEFKAEFPQYKHLELCGMHQKPGEPWQLTASDNVDTLEGISTIYALDYDPARKLSISYTFTIDWDLD